MNQFLPTVPNQGLRIKRMIIADTGTYEQQWSRPLRSFVTDQDRQNAILALRDRIRPNTNIVPGSFTGLTGQMLGPQFQVERPIQIPNGWSEHRFRWTALLEYTDAQGMTSYQVVTGLTDTRGVSHGGAFDDNMVFHIGSVTRLRRTEIMTPGGTRTMFNVAESTQLLTRHDSQGIRDHDKQFRLRPTDLFATMDRTHIEQDMQASGAVDTRTLITDQPVKSRRSNLVASRYLTSMLDSYRTSQRLEGLGQSEDLIFEEARGNTSEQLVSDDFFINTICSMRGTHTASWFTWRELKMMDPNVTRDEVTEFVFMGSPARVENTEMNVAGRSAAWDDVSVGRHPQVATLMSQTIPALLVELGFTAVHFTATNRTLDGRIDVAILNSFALVGLLGITVDVSQQLTALQSRMLTDVFMPISFNGDVDFAVVGTVDLLAESRFTIELNNNQSFLYTVPSFADSLLSPLVTVDPSRPVAIARDFQRVFNGVLDDVHDNPPLIQPPGGLNNNMMGFGTGGGVMGHL